MSFFPITFHQEAHRPFGREVAPFASIFSDFDRAIGRALQQHVRTVEARVPKFNPNFDVQETEEAYHLSGDLPGVEQKDLSIQFLNENTLSISGRTESLREEGTRPEALAASEPNAAIEGADASPSTPKEADSTPDTASTTETSSSSYHKPTVEDDFTNVTASEAGIDTPTSSTPTDNALTKSNDESAQQVSQQHQQQQKQQQQRPTRRTWIQERSIGTFERQFPFPGRIDQEGVKASLRNGVLRVVVPKAKQTVPRRIVVE